jgi:hypothetical protein
MSQDSDNAKPLLGRTNMRDFVLTFHLRLAIGR